MTPGFNHESIGFWLTRRSQLSPDKIAIDFEDQTWTYRVLNERSNRAAATFRKAGLERGDRVAVLSENCPEYIEIFFACAKLGLILAPVSWRLSREEMAWQVKDSTPALLVASEEWESQGHQVFRGEVLVMGEGGSYETALSQADDSEPDDICLFDDPLMILYTSGTTGRPKGAVLTHGNFFWANLNMMVAAEFTASEVSLVFLPMFHIGGWNINTLTVFLKGGTVILEKAFDAGRMLELIPKKKVTWLMGVPSIYLFLSQHPDFETADLSSVRQMVVGGAPMPEALLETYRSRGIQIIQGYGLTELAPNALILPMDQASARLGSAGQPYFFTDTWLMDDNGQLLEPPSTGEIVARGPVVMKGYWNREDATMETIRDGWLHTGDVGRTDEDGYFFVVDRKTDMIISGGENIYPAEIENVIYHHPAVAEAAVFGIPDETWGERVHAVIVPKDGLKLDEKAVAGHCGAFLAKFKVPRSIELRSEPLPRTPAGKVKKAELRAPYWEGRDKKI